MENDFETEDPYSASSQEPQTKFVDEHEKEARLWAMALHFSMLLGYALPVAGFAVPIIIWQVKKDEFPQLDAHGKSATNWMISQMIYLFICIVLVFLVVGVPLLLMWAIVGFVFPFIGGIKANGGEVWEYPLSFRFF